METKQRRVLGWLCLVIFMVFTIWGMGSVEAQTIGKTIDKSNYQEYESMLIPAQMNAAKNGEWTFPTANLSFPYRHSDHFLAASEKNAGKFDITDNGDLIDKTTGKFPTYNVYGMPFPKIDPKDPKVAQKIMWNFKFQLYRFGAYEKGAQTYHVGRGGVERELFGRMHELYYQGRPPGQEIKNNPQKFVFQEVAQLTAPMGLKGNVIMTWSYMDERPDTVFSYLPVIRRTRQLSAGSRSDATWGGDGWMDRMDGWGGKNTTFKWKFLGERMLLVPFGSIQKVVTQEAPNGTMTMKMPRLKFGFGTPGWKGSPWAFTNAIYVPRSVWMIEGYPLDPYYNYGRHIFYIDKETYFIGLSEVCNKAGEFWKWSVTLGFYNEAPSGNNTVGLVGGYVHVDEKIHHGEIDFYPYDSWAFGPISRLGPSFFTVANVVELSK